MHDENKSNSGQIRQVTTMGGSGNTNISFCVKTLKKMFGDANCIKNNVGVLEVSSRTLNFFLIFFKC
jgi:hypothetical protein